jgi:hypothetical protein
MAESAQLDHAVINVRRQMDQAEDSFRDLGFHLTDRGYHTLGSINHLMIFGRDYLELIGLPDEPGGDQSRRPDIANAPFGINGLVFKTADVDETFAHLQKIGMAGNPPKAFSRPVVLDSGTLDAHFRTVHVRDGVFPGGRVYFCEHATPELVWRSQWQHHRNGALAMPEFVIASANHAEEAEDFAKLLRADISGAGDLLSIGLESAAITLLSPRAYQERYRDLASSLDNRSSIFGALVMKVNDLAAIRGVAATAGLATMDEGDSVIVRQETFDSVLEFVSA